MCVCVDDTDTDILSGGLGGDEMHGCAGNDVLFGEEGTDHLVGGDDLDTCDGGSPETNDVCDSSCESSPQCP
jgi:Ca2+-binding RTX toxin-like protein